MKRMLISLGYGLAYLAMIGFYSYLRLKEPGDNSLDSQSHRSQLKKSLPGNQIEKGKQLNSVNSSRVLTKNINDSVSQPLRKYSSFR